MRIIQLLLLSFIVVSCGTSRIKYVRTKDQPKEVVESTFASTAESKHYEQETLASIDEIPIAESYVRDIAIDDTVVPTATSIPEPAKSANDKEERVKDALRAEREAKVARNILVSSTITLPIVVLPFFTLAGIILFIIGAIKYSNANKARYITPRGDRALFQGRIFLITSSILLGLVLALATLVLLIIFI